MRCSTANRGGLLVRLRVQGGPFGFQIRQDDAEQGYGSRIVGNVSQKPPVPPNHCVDLFAFFAHLEHPKQAA